MTNHRVFFLLLLIIFSFNTQAQHTLRHTEQALDYKVGLSLYDKNYWLSAQQFFITFLQKYPYKDDRTADATLRIALCALELEQIDADKYLNDFVRNYPNHPAVYQAFLQWGMKYYDKKDYEKTRYYLEKLPINQFEYDTRQKIRFALAKSYFYEKEPNYEKADLYFTELKLSEKSPYRLPAYYYSGYIAYQKQEYEQAIDDLSKSLYDEKYKLYAPVVIADIYYKEDEYEKLLYFADSLIGPDIPRENILPYQQINYFSLLAAEVCYQNRDYNNSLYYYKSYLGDLPDRPTDDITFKIGYTQFQVGEYENAANTLEDIADRPNSLGQKASYYLAISYMNNNQKTYAVNALRQAASQDFEPTIQENALYTLGVLCYDLDYYNEAVDALQNYKNQYPNGKKIKEVNNLLGKAYIYNNDYEQAAKYFESQNLKDPANRRAYQQITFFQGISQYNDENYEQAINLFQKSLSYADETAQATPVAFWLAETYSIKTYPNQTELEETLNNKVVPLYQQILRIYEPSDNKYALKALYGIGYAHYNLQNHETAITYLQQYISFAAQQAHPDFIEDAKLRLADCMYAIKEYSEANQIYNEIVSTSQQDSERDYATLQMAMIATRLNQSEIAQKYLNQIINKDNSVYYDQALLQLGISEADAEHYAIAIDYFSKLIEERTSSKWLPDAYSERAMCYESIKDNDKATEDYKYIIDNFPQSEAATDAIFALQDIWENTNNNDALNAYANKFKIANPESTVPEKIKFETAKNAYYKTRYEEALGHLNEFSTTYPESILLPDAHFFMAESYFKTQQLDQALPLYEKIIREKKGSFVEFALRQTAELYAQKKDYGKAIGYYFQLTNLTSSTREKTNGLAGIMNAYAALAKYDSVRFYADEILKQETSGNIKNQALLAKGKAYYHEGNYEEATALFKDISINDASQVGAEAMYLTGDVLYKQKNYEEAILILSNFDKKFTQYETWRGKGYLLIADCYIAEDKTFQARATLRSIIDNTTEEETRQQAQSKLDNLQ
ncbi:MAG: hypothetical protein EAZ55_02985 [Cytophagales bacterium]|nr:MAG: hypothetical protein EAZ55_02985 [Cytophagales bacterium]